MNKRSNTRLRISVEDGFKIKHASIRIILEIYNSLCTFCRYVMEYCPQLLRQEALFFVCSSISWWETNQIVTVVYSLKHHETHETTSLSMWKMYYFAPQKTNEWRMCRSDGYIDLHSMEIFTLTCQIKYEHYFNATM